MSPGARVSPGALGTQMRPSLRSDSLISVSFAWWWPVTGIQVGWICVKPGFANAAPRLWARQMAVTLQPLDRKSTRLNSSHGYISYAVFCLKKKKKKQDKNRQCRKE